jgi:hypothetical protein
MEYVSVGVTVVVAESSSAVVGLVLSGTFTKGPPCCLTDDLMTLVIEIPI